MNPNIRTYVIDPLGSGLFDYIRTGQIEKQQNIHGLETRLIPRSLGSSIAEGIGIDRITTNFDKAELDGAL